MKKLLNIIGIVLGILLTLSMTVYAFANVSKAGDMVGVVAAKQAAAIEVMDQPGAKGIGHGREGTRPGPVVDRRAPGRQRHARASGSAFKPCPRARAATCEVKIDDVTLTDKLIVALHADRGVVGTFEFSKDKFDSSPDKPYFVDGMELAMEASVAGK